MKPNWNKIAALVAKRTSVIEQVRQLVGEYAISPTDVFPAASAKTHHAAIKKTASKAIKVKAKTRKAYTDGQKHRLLAKHQSTMKQGLSHKAASKKIGVNDAQVYDWKRRQQKTAEKTASTSRLKKVA